MPVFPSSLLLKLANKTEVRLVSDKLWEPPDWLELEGVVPSHLAPALQLAPLGTRPVAVAGETVLHQGFLVSPGRLFGPGGRRLHHFVSETGHCGLT